MILFRCDCKIEDNQEKKEDLMLRICVFIRFGWDRADIDENYCEHVEHLDGILMDTDEREFEHIIKCMLFGCWPFA